jgi:hypothetical protein
MQDSLLLLEVYNTLFLESLVSRNLTYPVSRPRDNKLRKIKLGFPAAKGKGTKDRRQQRGWNSFVTCLLYLYLCMLVS